MSLTDIQVRKAKPKDSAYKLADEKGLYVFVATTGTRSWRYKYRFAGKEKVLTFGTYPEVSLTEARDRRDVARKAVRDGLDPGLEKKKRAAEVRTDAANSFEAVARAWHELNEPRWSKTHAKNVIDSLEQDVFPEIGSLPVREVNEALLLGALQKVEKRGAIERAKRIRQRCSEVFAFAAANAMRTGDPAAVIKTLLLPKPPATNQPAITNIEGVRQLLRDVEDTEASPVTKLAHRLLAITAVRSAVQCGARWEQFEALETARPLWRVPPTEMKLKLGRKADEAFEHLVTLPRQGVEVVEAMRSLTDDLPYVFPNERHAHRPMTNNAVRALIIRAKDGKYLHRHCPHGWRSAFSTIMNEWRRAHGRPDDREVIDLMLAHVHHDKVEGAYNRAAHLERRYELAQIWADMILEGLPPAADLMGPNWR